MIPDGSLFSFRVFGVPVEIGATALMLVAFLALSAGRAGSAGLLAGLATAVVLIVSVLVHELGHALVAGRLGLRPRRIVLHGFGGFTEYGRVPSPGQGVVTSLAGPGAGLLVGVGLFVLDLVLGARLPPHVAGLLATAIGINIFWSLFNLLPIYPMDGGQVLWYGLRLRLPATRAERIVRNVTIPTALVVGVLGFLAGYIFVPLICFFAILRVWNR